ncbi:MAG: transketolase family protein [Dehalococcoidia bacterium]|nr:transketolase family protein [Dehalococcoidia bacterium]
MTNYSDLSTREAYGTILVELGQANNNIVVLDADVSRSTMTKFFAQAFPERFVECGLAEQNMISIAAGLASCGKIPFASTFAVFASSRCFDQVRMCIAQPKMNAKIVATHGGVTVGEDGSSHQAIEDIALFCSLPNFTVVVPSDSTEAVEVIKTAVSIEGPFYIRLGRPKTPVLYGSGCAFKLGKADILRDGNDVTIVSTGIMVAKALEAAGHLSQSGISCRVLNMSTLKPVDVQAIIEAARITRAIVTAEEHLLHGGLGSMVAQILASSIPVPMISIGINDTYCKSGKPEELLEIHGLTSENIEKAVKDVIARKSAA